MSKKIIEKGTVQETLLLPLYGRKRAMEMYPGIFDDKDCQWIFDEVEISYQLKGIMEKVGAIMAATRRMGSSFWHPVFSIILKRNR